MKRYSPTTPPPSQLLLVSQFTLGIHKSLCFRNNSFQIIKLASNTNLSIRSYDTFQIPSPLGADNRKANFQKNLFSPREIFSISLSLHMEVMSASAADGTSWINILLEGKIPTELKWIMATINLILTVSLSFQASSKAKLSAEYS